MKLPNPTATLRQIPPVGWIALAAFGGLMFLVWHQYCQDPEDTNWNDPKQPPTNVDTTFDKGLPNTHQAAFRSRNWPGTLAEAPGSILGLING